MTPSNVARSTFSPKEQATLTALADAIYPRLEEDPSNPLYPLSASDLDVPRQLIETLSNLENQDEIKQLKLFLRLVESPVANVTLAAMPKAFSRMSFKEQQQYLFKLATHRLSQMRAAFRSIKALTGAYYFAGLDQQGKNPTWEAMGYPGPPYNKENRPEQANKTRPIKPLKIDRHQTLSCDAVIIGSGAGGGVVAGVLAAAGKDVIVLEKGGYYQEADFNQNELEAFEKLYLDRGLTTSADKGISLLAGGCLGGGTVVNWTTSFPTPERVRQEWDDEEGWEVFYTPQYERSTQAILKRMGVSRDYNRLAKRDQIMWRGLEALGWHRDTMPRNVRNCTQAEDCGFCSFGCPLGAKQSTLVTYLEDAYQNGARIIVNCAADRVLTERGRASGVAATAYDPASGERYQLTVRAKAVILAAGAINTPAVLLRSGLGGPAVGKYLRLHPATAVSGLFDERIDSWNGVMQGAYSSQFSDLDGKGYGAILETGPIHMSVGASGLGWEDGRSFKDLMLKVKQTASIVVITRDKDSGSITINRQGLPVINYNVSKHDLRHARATVAGAVRLLEAAGASEIRTLNTVPPVYRPGSGETIESFMQRVDRQGWGPNQMAFFSYHQMGSARMGSNPQTSVVNEYNECHTTPGLYVTDGSAFPGASGVNPMITIETIAHRAATYLANRLEV
ncbi:MAG TPA: GMC family oxidoreductase N-terminal domain-containing protein [Chloroflexia bacterium]|nr:GMC family oxidoreductase N-terminal domain-containing protein [Chloroflexia bacterium]